VVVVSSSIRTPEPGYAVTPLFGAQWGDSLGTGAETHTMPTDLSEHETGGVDVLFADDLQGTTFSLRESAVYEAEEVREEAGTDIPKFGNWMPVTLDDGTDGWMVALGELVEELQLLENAQSVECTVTRCQKSGDQQTDPYEVNVEIEEGDPKQSGL